MNLSQSTKTSLRITSCGIELDVTISGTPDAVEQLLTSPHWRAMIPSVTLTRTRPTSMPARVSIECVAESCFQYDSATNHIKADMSHLASIIATISYILEQIRQEHMQYTLHGNLLSRGDNHGIALIGGISGIGKSSLSAYAQRHGWLWLSDDKFVIDAEARCIGTMSKPLDDIKTRQAVGAQTIDQHHETPTLSHIVIPIVTDEARITLHQYEHEKALWHIYEELSRDIRISNGLLDSFGPLPSFDTALAATNRRNSTQYYADTIPVTYVRGTLEDILRFLETL